MTPPLENGSGHHHPSLSPEKGHLYACQLVDLIILALAGVSICYQVHRLPLPWEGGKMRLLAKLVLSVAGFRSHCMGKLVWRLPGGGREHHPGILGGLPNPENLLGPLQMASH